MDAVQLIVNLLVPIILAWAGWLTKHVMDVSRSTDRCSAKNEAAAEALVKEMDRLAAEQIVSRSGYSELASALARLSAQTEMVLTLLEQLKLEIRK